MHGEGVHMGRGRWGLYRSVYVCMCLYVPGEGGAQGSMKRGVFKVVRVCVYVH